MTIEAVINENRVTLEAVTNDYSLTVQSTPIQPTIILTPVAEAQVPVAFEQRVSDLENDKIGINDTIDGGIIM